MLTRTPLGPEPEDVKTLVATLQQQWRDLEQSLPATDRADASKLPSLVEQMSGLSEKIKTAQEELLVMLEQIEMSNRGLALERARYRDMFQNAGEAQLITDRMGVIHDANRVAVQLFDLALPALRGKPLASWVDRDDKTKFRDVLARATQSIAEATVRIQPRSGPRQLVTLRGSLSGTKHELLWVVRVVASSGTHSIRLDADVEPPAPASVPRQRAAEQETEAGQPLHESLRSVLRSTALLRKSGAVPTEAEPALQSIEQAVIAQAAALDALHDAARVATRRLELSFEQVDWALVCRDAVALAQGAALVSGIELSWSGAQSAMVRGDRARLEQIVLNLISNALKFTPAGGRISVQLEVETSAAVLTVTDNGQGLAPSVRERIFQCFHRESSVGEYENAGLGIGLFLVKELSTLHDGEVLVESAGPAQGCRFSVRLPLAATVYTSAAG